MPSPGPSPHTGGSGRLLTRVQFANMWNMASGLKELIALSLLAGLGCGVALIHGDVLFVAVFCLAIAMTIVEAIIRL